MMEAVLPRSWKEDFAIAAKRDELLYREKTARFEDQQRKRRDEDRIEDQQNDAETLMVIEAALAPPEDVAAYRHQIDGFDATNTEALMDNQEAMDRIREKMKKPLAEAHILADGRRVFKTEDGQHVFDERGQELSLEIIDPADIDDKKPKWEPFKVLLDDVARLDAERTELLAYQTKLDEARERLDSGKITNKELKAMKADLAADMPDAVRAKLGLEQPKTDAVAKPEPSALPSDMDSLMQKTGYSPAPAM